jgi:hypothetical protein
VFHETPGIGATILPAKAIQSPDVPGWVLKLPQRPFEVGDWIYVIGLLCVPIDHGFELLFRFAAELRFGGCTLESGGEGA